MTPAFCGIQTFITVCTTTRTLTLSWARLIQSTPSHHVSLRSHVSVILLHERTYIPSTLFPLRFPNQYPVCISSVSHAWRMSGQCHPSLCDLPNDIAWGAQLTESFTTQLCSVPCNYVPLRPKCLPERRFVAHRPSVPPLGCERPSNWRVLGQICSSVYFCVYILRHQTERQRVLDGMAAGIPWI